VEEDCLSMHKVINTQTPPLYYWTKTTEACIREVKGLAYFTIDAGPNVHIICEAKDQTKVLDRVKRVSGVQSVLVNKPAPGTRLIATHLW